MEVEILQVFHIRIEIAVQDPLPPRHDLIVADGKPIIRIDYASFCDVIMVIL